MNRYLLSEVMQIVMILVLSVSRKLKVWVGLYEFVIENWCRMPFLSSMNRNRLSDVTRIDIMLGIKKERFSLILKFFRETLYSSPVEFDYSKAGV